jgi:hypothetical protein
MLQLNAVRNLGWGRRLAGGLCGRSFLSGRGDGYHETKDDCGQKAGIHGDSKGRREDAPAT